MAVYNTPDELQKDLIKFGKSYDLYSNTGNSGTIKSSPATYEIITQIFNNILSQPGAQDAIKSAEDSLNTKQDDRLGDDPVNWALYSDSAIAQITRDEAFEQLSELLTDDNFFGDCGDDGEGSSNFLAEKNITYNPCNVSDHTNLSAKNAVEQVAAPAIINALDSALSRYVRIGDRIINTEGLSEEQIKQAIIDAQRDSRSFQGRAADNLYKKNKAAADKALENLQNRKDDLNTAVQNSPYGEINIGFKEQCFFLAHLQTFMALRGQTKAILDKKGYGDRVSAAGRRHGFQKEMPHVNTNGADGNRCMQLHGEPFGFINKLTQSRSKSYFFDTIDAAALSTLQPMIRLFKVETDENGREYTIELNFDSYSRDIALSLQTQGKRGSGVGINNFSFAYEATNPFGLKKTITSKLSIFANSFNELLAPRYGTGTYDDGTLKTGVTYQYTDLALKTTSQTFKKAKFNPQNADVALRNYEKVNFRLKAVVGYAAPYSGNGNFDYNAIYNSFVTLNLTPTIHEFKIDETGRVTFDINYLAYVEDFFDHPSFNVFSDPDIALEELKDKFEHIMSDQKCQSKETDDNERTEKRKKIEENKLANFNALIKNLIDEFKIFQIDMSLSDLAKYQATGPLMPEDPDLLKTLIDKYDLRISDITTDKVNIPENGEDGTGTSDASNSDIEFTSNPIENIPFFWASDLVDVILKYIGLNLEKVTQELKKLVQKNISDNNITEAGQFYSIEYINYQVQLENFKRFRVLLGPMEVVNPTAKEGEIISVISNLGDVPISVKYFLEWLTNKVLKTDRQIYPLPVFLNQFFNNFIRDFLNNDTCYGNAAKQKVRMGQASISAYNTLQPVEPSSPYVDDIQYLMEKYKTTTLDLTQAPQPVLSVMGYRDDPRTVGTLNQETNYLVYYASRVQPVEKMQGNRSADNSRGIFHYLLGSDKGIIKNITLNKNNAPGLAELRFEKEGYDGLAQLLVLYDAGIKTYFDATAFPGNYIYVEPKGFDPSLGYDITKLGIGGYFMIIKSEHSLGAGFAETNITAKWVAQIESNENKTAQEIADQQSCDQRHATRRQTSTISGFEQTLKGVPGLGFLSDVLGDTNPTTKDNGANGSEGEVT